jgi:hypothetical protein
MTKQIVVESKILTVAEATGKDEANRDTGRNWTFNTLEAAAKQRAEFEADLADPSSAAAKAELDKLVPAPAPAAEAEAGEAK